jgi:biotin synthase
MNQYELLTKKSLENGGIAADDCTRILKGNGYDLLPLLSAAFDVRKHYFGKNVRIHVINNVKNGSCSEDCAYCAQSVSSQNSIEPYPAKNEDEILNDAKKAYEDGAFRYCMVFSGSSQSANEISRICGIVRSIKKSFPMEICVSAGFLDRDKAILLKEAGVNRYNHNLNTSSSFYKSICTSHDYRKRLDTVSTAFREGLDVCSGVIIGMGETPDDIVSIIDDLKKVKVKSVPVNFFIPVEGNRIQNPAALTPEYCLRALCVFRFMLPDTEIRAAGGREYHLRSLQALTLYPANSLFAQGYLTHGGDSLAETIRMIEDAGFVIEKE